MELYFAYFFSYSQNIGAVLKRKEKSSKLLRPNLVCPRRKPQHQIYMLWQKLKECRKSNATHKNKINEHVFSSILQYY